jgi:2-C-methyl-D-erythritol 4-phosphate cytidylyltransferase
MGFFISKMKVSDKYFAIIVAGGSGTRMSSNAPKQFLMLADKPILIHTIEDFLTAIDGIQIILVLPSNHVSYWQALAKQYLPDANIIIVIGGTSRFESVNNGLNAIETNHGLVAVHDGVRPLVNETIIKESFTQAKLYGNAIVAVDLKDSIREVTAEGNNSRNRANYKLVQTPQTFQLSILKDAYKNGLNLDTSLFTDDASVIEANGEKINLINGSYENIKITTPEDLIIAEAILSYRSKNQS